ncbi:hypothetical protein CL1_1651 [Thermococcus cleftensis]|uniref:Uncharacterized protein n=1 Tax=Thermococcus cleftensis (strain DSM 27260 / KACC 17922 / CL1) TaxID=163003 RepID=I3ZVW4_THECF|nr:hypothetical protein [Thermococcus cleftensis]AFL95848.1 hypothetical protein CL1_1651 [Thermococcus cleftensis]
MESRTAEVPFSAGWEALVGVASRPEGVFPTFPYEAKVVRMGEKVIARLSVRKFLFKFEFEGVLEFTFNEPHVTYVMKGSRGLLILSFAALEGKLVARASADVPGERMLGKKLAYLAEGAGLSLAKMAESHGIIAARAFGSPRDFIIRNFEPSLLAHVVRYVRLNTGMKSFTLTGENGSERFTVKVKDGIVEKVEYESSSGSSIIEVGRSILEVDGRDFAGIDARGEYVMKVRD